MPDLIDDRSAPGFRSVYGQLLRRASALDVALTHLRLSTLDFSADELARVGRIRLLLAEVSAAALDAEAYAVLSGAGDAGNLRRLLILLEEGRVEVRSAPLGGWAPDFSVFSDGGASFALLVGPHRFDVGPLYDGPETASLHGPEGALRMSARFLEVWERGHDISPAIRGIVARADRHAHPAEG